MESPRLAKDIMVTKLVTLTPDMPVFDGVARLLKHNLTGAPVIDESHMYHGVFSEKCCMDVMMSTARVTGMQREARRSLPKAKDVMARKLITLSPEMDVCDAIGLLLKHRISGAPVIGEGRRFLGMFSEKTSMTVLVGAAYDQLPTTEVRAFMDTDPHRTIDPEKDLLSLAEIFLDTHYRRLPVLQDGALVGQVSRRDVLRAAHAVSRQMPSQNALQDQPMDAASPADFQAERVASYMDTEARTISSDFDLLSVAQIFREGPYRRLPVLKGRELLGQISRRDLLKATYEMMSVSPCRETALLYLSSVVDRGQVPL